MKYSSDLSQLISDFNDIILVDRFTGNKTGQSWKTGIPWTVWCSTYAALNIHVYLPLCHIFHLIILRILITNYSQTCTIAGCGNNKKKNINMITFKKKTQNYIFTCKTINIPNEMSRDFLKGKSIEKESEKRQRDRKISSGCLGLAMGIQWPQMGTRDLFGAMEKS